MKSKKSALLMSFTSLLICFAMLVGSTFAWFTDTATTGVNKIVSGKLKVDLVAADGETSLTGEGDKLLWTQKVVGEGDGALKAVETEGRPLWEPGVNFLTQGFKIANKGNLALKWKVEVNKGTTAANAGDYDLLDVIDFSVVTKSENGDQKATELAAFEGQLKDGNTVSTDTYYIKGHMQESAGNNYQSLTLDGITVTVYATQLNYENDSIGPDYDKDAQYPTSIQELKKKYSTDATNVPDGFVVTPYNNEKFDGINGKTGTITIKDAESLLYFAYVLDPAAALAEEPSTVWPHTSVWYGGSFAHHIVLDADIDLQGITLPNGFGNMKDYDFDGQGHTIKNAIINYTGTDNTALFAGGNCGISNLVVENIKVVAPNGTENAVGIVSSDANATIDNVTVRNSSVVGGKYTGAVVGYNYGSVTDCIVENCTVSGRYKVGGIVGYICNSNDNQTFVTGNTLTNVTVKGDNRIAGKSDFVIGKIVGNWNATVGTCKGNTFSGTTVATNNIGEVEARCTAGLTKD
mgnify:CR=1 FL=1